MKINIFLKGCALALATAAALSASAEPYDYTTKVINAYDHNGKLVSMQLASDVQYIEVEDYTLVPLTFTLSGNGASVEFSMIPVVGTDSYTLQSSTIKWNPTTDKTASIGTFYMGETEVTNALWKVVMGTVPSKSSKEDTFPVETVSWNSICGPGGFLDKLNQMVEQDPRLKEQMNGYEFSLPTEWEWEYAAIGGNHRDSYRFSGSNAIEEVGWYTGNAGSSTCEVAQKDPNSLGLYDMTGNVWEWCDSESFRADDDSSDDITMRVRRGGSYQSPSANCTTVYRFNSEASSLPQNTGFRLALKPKKIKNETFYISFSEDKRIEFNMIPVASAGTYTLKGKNINWPLEEKVALIQSFSIGQTVVTNALWDAVMNTNNSGENGGNLPVTDISWNAVCKANGFLDKLNKIMQDDPEMSKLLNGRKFYIPTEWEWEYAATGGIMKEKYTYSGSSTLNEVGWYEANSGNMKQEVAQKKPNGLGIFDMTGNIWEWCYADSFRADDDSSDDPTLRPRRGGSYMSPSSLCQISYRFSDGASASAPNTGIRLILK